MKRMNKTKQSNMSSILKKFFLGFLLPYLLINGIIFFIYTEVPHISIKEQTEDKQLSKIEFTIDSKLPIIDVKVECLNEEVPYTKTGNTYSIDANNTGTYKITAKALNQLTAVSSCSIESLDESAPVIDTESAIIANGTITINISDNQNAINYDSIYAKDENGNMISALSIDQNTGSVQFNVSDLSSIIIHVEDLSGNATETNISF